VEYLAEQHLVFRALLIGFIPAIMTIVGCLPVLWGGRLGDRYLYSGLGFSAGIMMVASFTSLLVPAMETSDLVIVLGGFVSGIFLVKLIDILIPHLHPTLSISSKSSDLLVMRKMWLIALAMIVHNIPEGLAIGALSVFSVTEALVLALAIGIQDIPEGFAVSIPVFTASRSVRIALGIGVLSGVVEMLATTIVPILTLVVDISFSYVMSLAAGAMVYVVVHEMIPDIYSSKHSEISTVGFFLGFITMLLLDYVFG